MDDTRRAVAQHLRNQGQACGFLGSPLYAALLARAADDAEAGGPVWEALEAFAGWPDATVYSLRLMGAVNRLVLEGAAPDGLAREYVGGGDGDRAWPAFRELVAERLDRVRELAQRPIQTNEVGRAAALAPAFVWIARQWGGQPLRLLEIGASGGLNLRWDVYRYDDAWGRRDSPVALSGRYEGTEPSFEPPVVVAERRGCDAAPVDATTVEGRLTLLSYVWPDQTERVALLRAALDVAAGMPVAIDSMHAGEWVEAMLAEPAPGTATVVFHSIVMQYLDDAERERVRAAIERAGAAATPDAPLAWLRMEPDAELARVDVTLWPEVRKVTLASAGYHGRPVRWLAD